MMAKDNIYHIDYEIGKNNGVIIIHLPKSVCNQLKKLGYESFERWMEATDVALKYVMKIYCNIEGVFNG